jgi:hypothetical protein
VDGVWLIPDRKDLVKQSSTREPGHLCCVLALAVGTNSNLSDRE